MAWVGKLSDVRGMLYLVWTGWDRFAIEFTYSWNKQSAVISWTTTFLCALFFRPAHVTIVSKTAFFVLVSEWKVSTLCRRFFSYSASIENASAEYFISQRLMTSSFRSIRRSICAPGVVFVLRHEYSRLLIPEIPRAFLIWRMCNRQILSKASPHQAE